MEDVNVRHAVLSAGGLKVVDVFHELELASRGVDLWHRAWQQFLNELAQNDAVPEQILEATGRQLLAEDGLDPGEHLAFEGGVALSGDLCVL